MKINSVFLALPLLISSAYSSANVATQPTWDKVTFDAAKFHVEAELGKDNFVSSLKIWLSGKEVAIPREAFERIKDPKLNKITVTYGSGNSYYLTVPVHAELKTACDPDYDSRCRWVFYFTDTSYTGMEEPRTVSGL